MSYLAEASCYVHQTPHIVCPATVSHVIALFATILCVRTLYSHPTPILVPSGKDAMQQTTKQNLLRYLNIRHGCHISNTASQNRKTWYIYKNENYLQTHHFRIYCFSYLKSRKMETLKHPVFWRFMWCGLVTTRALVGGCQNFAKFPGFLPTRLHGVVTQKNTKRIFTTGKTRCADSLLNHHNAFKV